MTSHLNERTVSLYGYSSFKVYLSKRSSFAKMMSAAVSGLRSNGRISSTSMLSGDAVSDTMGCDIGCSTSRPASSRQPQRRHKKHIKPVSRFIMKGYKVETKIIIFAKKPQENAKNQRLSAKKARLPALPPITRPGYGPSPLFPVAHAAFPSSTCGCADASGSPCRTTVPVSQATLP